MAVDSARGAVIDPEQVEAEFKKAEENKIKLEQLKSAVFKNYTIKRSKSVLHPPSLTTRQDATTAPRQPAYPIQEPTTIPSITSIQFGKKQSSSPNKPVYSLRKLPAFSPRKSNCDLRKTIFQLQTQRRQIEPQLNFRAKRNTLETIKPIVYRDSQTILRKNSLFLVNCLRTRYRQTEKKAHIGDAQNVGNMRLGFFSEKNFGATHYQQRFEYMQEARQRLLVARNVQGEPREAKTSQLHPEPW